VKRYKLRDLENAYREETDRVQRKLHRENWRKELLKKPKSTNTASEPERNEDLFE